MCKSAFYQHPVCGCRWLAITQQCAPGLGFSTCPKFFDEGHPILAPPVYRIVKSRKGSTPSAFPCPTHELFGYYDRNIIRMIVDLKKGIRWGSGPSRSDLGVEFNCSVM